MDDPVLLTAANVRGSGLVTSWTEQLPRQLMQLQDRLRDLGTRVASLERFHRRIILLTYPLTCQLDRDRPALQIEPRLKVALIRPGVFKFEFEPPKSQKPLVLATALKSWGNVPIEMSSLRVADVTLTGFTIETFEAAGPINPANVSFFFVILLEPSRLE